MTAKEHVLERYPQAYCPVFYGPSYDNGRFKVYRDRRTFVAMSASWHSEDEAWSDAWRKIQQREERQKAT